MKTKSFPVKRSRRKSLDPYPPLQERFGSREIDLDTVRPHKKRQFPLGEDIRGPPEPLKSDACIICQFSDDGVSSCSGVNCLLRFHDKCLTPEFGGSEDLSNPFCPYCWLQVVSLESKSLRDEAIRAEKAVYKYLDKGIVSDQGIQGEQLVVYSPKQDQFDKDSHQPEDEGTGMEEDNGMEDDIETSSEDEERVVAADNVEMNATDSETSSAMEPDGEDVSERGAATNVAAQPNPLRNFSFFDKDQRKKILWTPKEEEMLRMGVEKFSAEINKNMPWRKILQMGRNVFHETRKPAHLKDKWRCMTKPQQ
ncbi:unnamed protein product [Eruca vesicaria subsp. sativa]|uniref:Myb-like domain-containing protein n=1 Tax=Eruca vesicaria subsp. sativa TaxID=29727 RepID=A0ABC8J9R6_ERUVS|nr:unnamed protein product [Eruca vesicaria subsp. sativa]